MSDATPGRPTAKRVVRVALLGAPLYQAPDETADKVAYLNEGTLLEVLGEEKGFFHIKLAGGGTGYIRTHATEETGEGNAGATA